MADSTALSGDNAVTQVAWRTSAPEYDFMRNQSMQHYIVGSRGITLCGIRVPWHRINDGDQRMCGRCEAIAAKRGLDTESAGVAL